MKLVRYEDAAAVKAALLDGSLDAVIGAGVLEPRDIAEMRDEHKEDFRVVLTQPIQNRVVIFNTAKAPTDDLRMRKVIIHSIDKAAIVEKELEGLAEPVDGLFPKNAPYSKIELTPRWDYDIEKARLMNCPEPAAGLEASGASTGALVLIILLTTAFIGLAGVALYMMKREKAGKPLFTPLNSAPDATPSVAVEIVGR
jgi:ABC-type oligopeptide transport system substrate-binding subunit